MTIPRSRTVLDTVNVADFVGVGLSAAEFDKLIFLSGNAGEYRRATLCPCRRIDTNTPDISCPHCRGFGQLYPLNLREPMIVLDTNRNSTAKLVAAGKLAQGTIQITFPSSVVPAIGDMFLPEEEEHVVTEQLYRNGTQRVTDAQLRLVRSSSDQMKPAQRPRVERLLYPAPCCVEDVSYITGTGPSRRLVQANPSEYLIAPDGHFTWRGDHGPEPGKSWTIRYRAPAAYVVHGSEPMFRHQADQRQPHKVTAMRLDRVTPHDLDTVGDDE